MAPIYLGTDKLTELHIGNNASVQKVYLGTQLVWRYLSPIYGEYLLFNEGWISGISWQGNLLERPQYTSIADYNMSYVDSDGFMRLRIASRTSYSSVNYNCHVGVLPTNAPTAMSTAQGGQLQTNTLSTYDTWLTFSQNLGSGIAGSSLRAVVNMQANGAINGDQYIDINKVWFE